MRLGIVVVIHNGRGYVGGCLRSLRQSTYPATMTVCVDNASSDGSADYVAAEFPEVTSVRNETNLGFAAGANLGMRHCHAAGCDAVLLLNPDTFVNANATENLMAASLRHPRALLAPAILFQDKPHLLGTYAGGMSWWRGRMQASYLGRPAHELLAADERVATASGCCLLVPREVMDRIGFFDDSYFLYFEDADYIERASAAGFELWHIPTATIEHREGSATGGPSSPAALYYFFRNRHRFVRKFRKGSLTYLVFLAYASLTAGVRGAWYLGTGSAERAFAVTTGALDGWRQRAGPRPSPPIRITARSG